MKPVLHKPNSIALRESWDTYSNLLTLTRTHFPYNLGWICLVDIQSCQNINLHHYIYLWKNKLALTMKVLHDSSLSLFLFVIMDIDKNLDPSCSCCKFFVIFLEFCFFFPKCRPKFRWKYVRIGCKLDFYIKNNWFLISHSVLSSAF